MRTVRTAVALLVLTLMSCNLENDVNEAITSDSGVIFAKNKTDLLNKARSVFDKEDVIITNIEYMESKTTSSVIVSVNSKDGKNPSNFVMSKGKVSYDADSLKVVRNTSEKAMSDTITINCHGCANCKVQGTMEPDGTHHFECESACCVMSITLEQSGDK